MKVFIIIAIVLGVSWANDFNKLLAKDLNDHVNLNDIIANEIIAGIESFRNQLIEEGFPEFEIDSLDPLVIKNQRIKFQWFFELDLNITQETVGLLNFEVTNLDVQSGELLFDFTVNWPLIINHNDYGLLMKYSENQIFGNGQVDLSIVNFAISGHCGLSIDENWLVQLENLFINLNFDSLDFKITGFMNDEEKSKELSDAVTKNAPDTLKKIEKSINSRMDEFIEMTNKLIVDEYVGATDDFEEDTDDLDLLDYLLKYSDFNENE